MPCASGKRVRIMHAAVPAVTASTHTTLTVRRMGRLERKKHARTVHGVRGAAGERDALHDRPATQTWQAVASSGWQRS